MSDEHTQLTPEVVDEWRITRPIPPGSKLTPRTVAAVLQNIANGGYIEAACVAAGICKQTYYNWLERAEEDPESCYAEFAEMLERARAQAEIDNISIIKGAAATNWQAAAWLLERTQPDKYGQRNRTTVDGSMLLGHAPAAGLIAAMREGMNETNS